MKYLYLTILSFLFITVLSAYSQEQPDLRIVYPQNNANVNAPSTFILGSTTPGAKLTVNNEKVKVYPNGSFAKVVELDRGLNEIKIQSSLKGGEKLLSYRINVPPYEQTIPESPLKIDMGSIKPAKNLNYQTGDIIEVRFKGSADNNASFSIGERKDIPMLEMQPKQAQTKMAFGKAFSASDKPVRGIYYGAYIIQESDNFKNSPITVKLASKEKSISAMSTGKVTTIPEGSIPSVAEVKKENAVVRTAPDQSRLTPLNKGVRINITGREGNDYRFKMGEAMSGWISGTDIKLLPAGTPVSQSPVTSITMESRPDSMLVKIPLTQKLPVSIDQLPGPQMVLTIYGGTANLDIIPYPPGENFIKEVKWYQPYKDTFKLVITPNSSQFWGYKYYYENNTLILSLRKPLVSDANNVLKDKVITLDPGHGGTESGAMGLTGIPEKKVNLAIAHHLKTQLENSGAKIIMTRNADETVDLAKRAEIARNSDSHILLSIHNNALPDGRDPMKEHGSSSYYYHSQALPLAKSLQEAMVKNLGFKDYGIFYDNLAMTRPNEPLSVLIEVGFMINPEEYSKLIDPDFQKQAANALFVGLENFFMVNATSN